MAYLNSESKQIPHKDVKNPENRQKLIGIGGKGQVSCLIINGVPLHESLEIIALQRSLVVFRIISLFIINLFITLALPRAPTGDIGKGKQPKDDDSSGDSNYVHTIGNR